jgi:hypothetical protein
MKFSSKLYYDKNDINLVKRLRLKFGQAPIFMIGDWSAPNTKYQEPTRSKGLISMLKKKNEFQVYRIDKYRTSSFCPDCENRLEKFKQIENPRPYQRKKNAQYAVPWLTKVCNTNKVEEI